MFLLQIHMLNNSSNLNPALIRGQILLSSFLGTRGRTQSLVHGGKHIPPPLFILRQGLTNLSWLALNM